MPRVRVARVPRLLVGDLAAQHGGVQPVLFACLFERDASAAAEVDTVPVEYLDGSGALGGQLSDGLLVVHDDSAPFSLGWRGDG